MDIDEDKILGKGDDGQVYLVNVSAIITLPNDSTWKFAKDDEFEIISNTNSIVKVIGEPGVTIKPLSNAIITKKGSSIKIKYQGNNTYLMWGLVSLLIFIGFGIFTYNDTMKIIQDGLILINGE